MTTILERLGLSVPLVQAPMVGVSTVDLAASVSNAGALGSIGLGALCASDAAAQIAQLRERTARTFNVNLFVHAPPRIVPEREATWLNALAPKFAEFGATPPTALTAPYIGFNEDPEMLRMLVEHAPPVVSFHFGLPRASAVTALKAAGCVLLISVTSPAEADAAREAGIDVLVAQGYEAGGHRGIFDPDAQDDRLSTFALTRLLATQQNLPVIAAGGIMDGAGIRAARDLGAIAAQLGTAFIACPESSADADFRAALASPSAHHTRMVRAISGRPARCLSNRFTQWAETPGLPPVPDYPRTYSAGKALNTAAKARGESGYSAQWAGQGAPLSRTLPAAELVAMLAAELTATRT